MPSRHKKKPKTIRERAIDAVSSRHRFASTPEFARLVAEYLRGRRDALREICAKKRREPMRWISVTERLPEPRTDVLVYVPSMRQNPIGRGWHMDDANRWRRAGVCGWDCDVTHWQPLPPPPALHAEGAAA